ncbi:hypothetical protein ACFXPZ_00260 [Streptomyces sp. NPDC059101]|uniref:hypothetical protein n=1 Tax=unclassified Streptomyces TaxID=2593676 RepID=UPI000C275F3B|nr:hypothetical protein [Streptomyces sp. CB02959]PJN40068.1 hypothetical protein CG747_13340 [Streptomyces sp. CB02959]
MKRSPALVVSVLALVSGTAVAANAAGTLHSGPAAAPPRHALSADAAWCAQQGGKAETRVPYYTGTGEKITPLGGARDMCLFTAGDGSQIMIAADTLAADKPTLAALAYVRKPSGPSSPGNPSIAYCQGINGTAMFGNKPTDGGGWGPKNETDPSKAISACMFADGSVIDAWGLKYHEGGVIRGADLTKKFRAAIPGA